MKRSAAATSQFSRASVASSATGALHESPQRTAAVAGRDDARVASRAHDAAERSAGSAATVARVAR
jgi:hypothetical protein